MEQFVISPDLKDMLINFYRISGIRVGVHDLEMQIIEDYPHQKKEFADWNFCEKGKVCSGLFCKRCAECDQNAYQYARIMQKSYVYECHMGFMEAVIPIMVGGEAICFLMIGQVRRQSEDEKGSEQIEDRLRAYQFSEDRFPIEQALEHYQRMPYMKEETFRAFVYFLEMCAQVIYRESYIYIQNNKRAVTAELMKYVKANLYSDLNLNDVAKALNLSSSYLSHCIAKEMKTTFTKYVNACRIEEAKRIMRVTDMNAKQIAILLRYTDTAYFVKHFKRATGKTYTQYKKNVLQKKHADKAN